jgi:DNA-binding MarR family transcriptional regulator
VEEREGKSNIGRLIPRGARPAREDGKLKARPLSFDPIAEAKRQWISNRISSAESMSAAISIMRAHQILLSRIDTALRSFELTFARYEALTLLAFSGQGSLPLGKMGKRLMVHPTSITNTIDKLEEQGLVRRLRHPTDRRTILAEITTKGRDVARRSTKAVVEANFGLEGYGQFDSAQITRMLTRLRSEAGDFLDHAKSQTSRDAVAGILSHS